jgi:hypothetical protein
MTQRELLARRQKYGAGVALAQSATLQRDGARPAQPRKQYNMLVRLVKAGEPVELHTEVVSRSNQDRLDSDNVIAEISGTGPSVKDEVVL